MGELGFEGNDGRIVSLEEVRELKAEVRAGKPRRYIETFFKILDDEGNNVPLLFSVEQEEYYRRTFGAIKRYEEGFWAYLVKSRKARSTSLWTACETAFLFEVPGFNVVVIGAQDEHAKQVLDLVNHIYNNLPDDVEIGGKRLTMRPYKSHWDTERREIGFGPVGEDGKMDVKVNSLMVISTSKTRVFGLGKTTKMIHLVEKGSFSQEHEHDLMGSVMNGVPRGYWRVDDSTPGPMKSLHYEDGKSVRSGQVEAIYIVRHWYETPQNALARDSSERLPKDRGALMLTEEERQLEPLFPKDSIPVEDRIAWRRAKIAQNIRESYGDEARGRAMFNRQQVENDIDCWVDVENPIWDVGMMGRMARMARDPLSDEEMRQSPFSPIPFPGLKLSVWQLPYPGGRYVGGMDVADSPGQGDTSALEVLDVRTGVYVAEMVGRVRAIESVMQGAKVVAKYNNGLFAPEATGLGAPAIDALRREGYERLYYEQGQALPRRSEIPIKYGWFTTAQSKARMYALWSEALAAGSITIYSRELLADMQEFNPNADEHWPDRIMAAMIAYAVSLEAGRFGLFDGSMQGRFAEKMQTKEIVIQSLQAYGEAVR